MGDLEGTGDGAQVLGTGLKGCLDLFPVRKLRPNLTLSGVDRTR
jgi:hypothetical protein